MARTVARRQPLAALADVRARFDATCRDGVPSVALPLAAAHDHAARTIASKAAPAPTAG